MSAARPILSFAALILLAGGIVLQIFVILSGAVQGSPINKIYFLQAPTSSISGSSSSVPNPARWTYFAVCGVSHGLNAHCGKVQAALPFDPKANFHTQNGVPNEFLHHGESQFYYLSRIMFAFYLVALFFAVLALLMGIFALCARLAAYLTGFTAFLAMLFQAVAAALMTAWTVLARNDFKKHGDAAKLGTYAYGFTWGAFAAFLIATILFCVGGKAGKNDSSRGSSSYFGRKRSTKTQGSFRDSESGRRVKDEYD